MWMLLPHLTSETSVSRDTLLSRLSVGEATVGDTEEEELGPAFPTLDWIRKSLSV